MQTILLDQSQISQYKLDLAKHLPEVKSSHRTEALAAGFGFSTYASLITALSQAPTNEVERLFSDAMFFGRLKALKYEGIEKYREAVQQVFSVRAHIERKNRFGSQAIIDLVAAAGYSAMQHDFLDATLLGHVIAEGGEVNKASIAYVAKHMCFGDLLLEHSEEIGDVLSIKRFSDTDASSEQRLTAERTIAVCWDLGAASRKKVLSSTSTAIVPCFRSIEFNVKDDVLEFVLHPSALNFLRARHRLHYAKDTSTGLSPRDKETLANVASISIDAIADLKAIAKGMGLSVDQLAETLPQVKTAIESAEEIISKTSEQHAEGSPSALASRLLH